MKLEKRRRGNNSAGGESGLNGSNNWSSVCYGDHVRLSMNAASNALLGAEGVINSEIRVLVDSKSRMDRCVWQICSAYQYSAAKELNEYVKEIEDSRATNLTATDADIESDRNDSHLYALKRGKAYEDTQNAATNQAKRGKPVNFGDTIQLLHVNSGKFLTVRSEKVAEAERENLSVCLDASGSIMSHLIMIARLKIDEESGLLANNTGIFLKIAEREREFVHCSDNEFKFHSIAFSGAALVGQKCYTEQGESYEVNCSLTKTLWSIQVYDAADDDNGVNLRAGDIIYLHDPEAKMTLHLTDPSTMAMKNSNEHEFFAGSEKDNPTTITPVKSTFNSKSNKRRNNKFDAFFRTHRDDSNFTDSNAYWVIEKEDLSQGGRIWMGGEEPVPRVKFRHFNSGRYLYLHGNHMRKGMAKIMASKILNRNFLVRQPKNSHSPTPLSLDESRLGNDKYRTLKDRPTVRIVSTVQDAGAGATRFKLVHYKHVSAGPSKDAKVDSPLAEIIDTPGSNIDNKMPAESEATMVSESTLVKTSSVYNLEVESFFVRRASENEKRKIGLSSEIDNDEIDADDSCDDESNDEDDEKTAAAKRERKMLRIRAEKEGGEALSHYKLTVEAQRKQRRDRYDFDRTDGKNVTKVIPCVASVAQSDALPLVIKTIPSASVAEAAIGQASYPYFEALSRALAEMRTKAVAEQTGPFCNIARRLVNFVCGLNFNVDSENLAYKSSQPIPSRQRLMREQGILGTTLDILKSIVEPETSSTENKNQATLRSVSPPPSMDHHPISEACRLGNFKFITVVRRSKKIISRACFQLLYYSIRENPEIQRFTAKMLPVFLFHCEHESMATRCIVEMLQRNRELQEREVTVREIKVFVRHLKDSPMNPLFFELLKATCVCSGKGVDKNQQLVANELIIHENNRQLLVKVTLNEKKRQSPSPRIRDTSSLHATWNVNNCSEFSPKVLFEGKDTVDFPTLFAVYKDERVLSLERRLSIGSQYNIVRIKAAEDNEAEPSTITSLMDTNNDDNLKPKPKRQGKSLWQSLSKRSGMGNTAANSDVDDDANKSKRIAKIIDNQRLKQASIFGGDRVAVTDQILEASLNIIEPLGAVFTAVATVEEIKEQSQAARAGLQPGCRICSIGEEEVASRKDIKNALRIIAERGESNFFTIKYRLAPRTTLSDVVMARRIMRNRFDKSREKAEADRMTAAAVDREQSLKASQDAVASRKEDSAHEVTSDRNKIISSRRSMSIQDLRRKMVADYLINQILLFGAMCFDRNYVCLKRIRETWSYDILVAIITDYRMPSKLRSAAVYLVTSLYVDSKPQAELPVPNLIRCWKHVDVFAENSTLVVRNNVSNCIEDDENPPVENSETKQKANREMGHSFIELKNEIAKHLTHLDRGDDLTKQQMRLLKKLMQFQIYVSVEQMQTVVHPLLKSLDDRHMYGKNDPSQDSALLDSKRVYPETFVNARYNLYFIHIPFNPKKVLDFMESITIMIFILVVVLVSVVLTVWAELTFGSKTLPQWLSLFDLIVFGFFAIELSVRLLCYYAAEDYNCSAFVKFWDFYRGVDGFCVILDVAALIAGSTLKSVKAGAKLLKLLRLVRLVRLVRAANLMIEIMNSLKSDEVEIFALPNRYDQTSMQDLIMLENAVDVLTHVVRVARDYRLSQLLQAFKVYDEHYQNTLLNGVCRAGAFGSVQITSNTTPRDLFDCVVNNATRGPKNLSLGSTSEISYILLNLCCYSGSTKLVQSALVLLMECYNARRNLLLDLKRMQLLTTTVQEKNLYMLQEKLGRLKSHGESYELWLNRSTAEELNIAQEVRSYLLEVVEFVNSKGSRITMPLDRPPSRGNTIAQSLLKHLDGSSVIVLLFDEVFPSLEDFGEAAKRAQAVGDEEEMRRNERLHADTVEILTLCNRLICGYVSENYENQLQVHKSIDIFVKSIDVGVQSASVIAEIFRGNDLLISRFQDDLVVEMCDQIVKTDRNPESAYVLQSITQTRTNPSPQLTELILRELTDPTRCNSTIYLAQDGEQFDIRNELCKQAQRDLTLSILRDENTMKHLPPLLAYHVTLVNVLAACANNTKNVNIIEAKLQSLYPLEHLISGLLNPNLTIECHLALLRYFKNAYIDAEMKNESLAASKPLWRFILTVPEKLQKVQRSIEKFKYYYDPPFDDSSTTTRDQQNLDSLRRANHKKILMSWTYSERMHLEAAFEILCILELFFFRHFISTEVPSFISDDEANYGDNTHGDDEDKSEEKDVADETFTLFNFEDEGDGSRGTQNKTFVYKDILGQIRDLVEGGGIYVTDRFVTQCIDTAEAVRAKTGLSAESIWNHVYWNIPIEDFILESYRKNRYSPQARYTWTVGGGQASSALVKAEDKDVENGNSAKIESKLVQPATKFESLSQRKFSVSHMIVDGNRINMALENFIYRLEIDESLSQSFDDDLNSVLLEIEGLPDIRQPPQKGDLRREYLIQRLVAHVRASTQIGPGLSKHLEETCTQTTSWLLRSFREMIQTKWGMTVDDRDEFGSEKEDLAAAPTHAFLNNNGVTALCLDLISMGIQDDVKIEAIKLLIAMLFKEGGNEAVQVTIHHHLHRNDSSAFFFEVKNMFSRMIKWHEEFPQGNPALSNQSDIVSTLADFEIPIEDDDKEPVLPPDTTILKMMQLMCEGHFQKNQDILRFQAVLSGQPLNNADGAEKHKAPQEGYLSSDDELGMPNKIQENLLDYMADHLNTVSKLSYRVATKAAIQVAELILEVLQGPCPANQVHFCLKTDLLEILNRMMRNNVRNDQIDIEEKQLKHVVIKIFQALLEGRSARDDLYKKIVGIVHLDVLIRHVNIPIPKGLEGMVLEADGEVKTPDESGALISSPQSSSNKKIVKKSRSASFVWKMLKRVLSVDEGERDSSDDEGNNSEVSTEKKSIDRFENLQKVKEVQVQELHDIQQELQTQVLVLLGMLSEFDPTLKRDKMMIRLEELMSTEVQSVEVVWHGVLQRRFFHVPRQLTALIGEATKHHLLYSIDLNNQDNKLDEFVTGVEDIYLELKWQEYLRDMSVQFIFSRDVQNWATWINFSLALLLNAMFLVDFEYRDFHECNYWDIGRSPLSKIYLSEARSWNNDEYSEEGNGNEFYMEVPCLSPTIALIARVLNYIMICLAAFTFVLSLVVRCKPNFDKIYEEDLSSFIVPLVNIRVQYGVWTKTARCVIMSLFIGFPPALYYLAYAIMCLLILTYYPPLCSFLLLDIVVKSPTTANVLMAVWKPRKNLGWTILLLLFCVYVFAVSYFFSFRTQDDGYLTEQYNSLWLCFLSVLNWGMRLSGGAGDMMTKDPEGGRVAVDFLYFWVIIVVLLNIIFGIIIDTFAELRGKSMEREFKTKKFCFICGISSEIFDKAAQLHSSDLWDDDGIEQHSNRLSGWSSHYHKDHNIWNYAYFIINLKEQDKDDDDGLELYVRQCIMRHDVDWFPKNRALCLVDDTNSEKEYLEDALGLLEKKVEDSENALAQRTDRLQRGVDALSRSQRNLKAKLQDVTELLMSQTEALERLADGQARLSEKQSINHSFTSGGGGDVNMLENTEDNHGTDKKDMSVDVEYPCKDDNKKVTMSGNVTSMNGTLGIVSLESHNDGEEGHQKSTSCEEAFYKRKQQNEVINTFGDEHDLTPGMMSKHGKTSHEKKFLKIKAAAETQKKTKRGQDRRKKPNKQTMQAQHTKSAEFEVFPAMKDIQEERPFKAIDIEAWRSNQNKKVLTAERQSMANDLREKFGFDARPGEVQSPRTEWQGPISQHGPNSIKNFYVARNREDD